MLWFQPKQGWSHISVRLLWALGSPMARPGKAAPQGTATAWDAPHFNLHQITCGLWDSGWSFLYYMVWVSCPCVGSYPLTASSLKGNYEKLKSLWLSVSIAYAMIKFQITPFNYSFVSRDSWSAAATLKKEISKWLNFYFPFSSTFSFSLEKNFYAHTE